MKNGAINIFLIIITVVIISTFLVVQKKVLNEARTLASIEKILEDCGEGYFLSWIKRKEKFLEFKKVYTCSNGDCLTDVKLENKIYSDKHTIGVLDNQKMMKEKDAFFYCRSFNGLMECKYDVLNNILNNTILEIKAIGFVILDKNIFALSNTSEEAKCDKEQIIAKLNNL
tara:strand:+ start:1233 stop:1745 length:513 start_codon:yes stop_codon:yes gene_type:complete